MKPNPEQLAALQAFKRLKGRYWKYELHCCWESGRYPASSNSALLQQVRNELGPMWLRKAKV